MAISTKRSTNENSKFAKAKLIYTEMASAEEVYTRKQILERFISELELTPAGAKTYYFKIHKAA